MADWYVKQAKEHPHLVYLEDPFQEARGYRSISQKLQDAGLPQKVEVGVKNFLNSDLDLYKDITTLIEIPPPTEEELKAQEAAAAAAAEEVKVDPKAKGGKKGGAPEEAKAPVAVDPNESKFFPSVISLTRSKIQTTSDYLAFFSYSGSLEK